MMSATDEDLELELRSLPGVLNVEIRHLESGEVDVVTLIVNGQDPAAIRVMAKQIVSLYSAEGSVVVDDATTAFRPHSSEAARVNLVGTPSTTRRVVARWNLTSLDASVSATPRAARWSAALRRPSRHWVTSVSRCPTIWSRW